MKESDFEQPPIAKKKKHILEKFNITRQDDYFWLRDKNNQEVIDYLNAENNYTKKVMDQTVTFQKEIYDEILGRIKEDDESYPLFSNNYFYYHKTLKGMQYPIICRKKESLKSQEEIIFDVNKLASNHDAFIFSNYKISPNNKFAAYLYNTTGSFAEFTLKVKNLETNENLDFVIDDIDSFEWANDSQTLIYTKIDDTLRSFEVFVQNIFQKKVNLVYREEDPIFSVYVCKDRINKSAIITSYSSTTIEQQLLSLDNPFEKPTLSFKREKGVDYDIIPHASCFYLLYKDSDNFNKKIYKLDKENYQDRSSWQEILPHREDVKIESVTPFANFLVVEERKNGLVEILILDILNNYHSTLIEFQEEAYQLYLESENNEYESNCIRYIYSSLKRPLTVFDYDVIKKQSITRKVQEIPSGFNPDDYTLERVWANADDGKKVPMAIVYKKDLIKNGQNPTLLYAYGSYGFSAELGYRSSIFSLIDRGFIYASAQIRGGSDLGEKWYEDGKFLKKKNTFTDFINCAEYLINEKYTSANKLSIKGGSAGGLLMGAVSNMRPELFNSVILGVPFVDVVTTMLDESLPLTAGEYEEWGNPNEEEYFKYMLSYSPYDNLESKDYPSMLVTGGLNDSQVLFHEPAKYTAKLRSLKTNENILLLHMNMKSGHGGGTGRYDKIDDIALEFAFIYFLNK